jgi:tetratricopeptide (TPR) repeat protein
MRRGRITACFGLAFCLTSAGAGAQPTARFPEPAAAPAKVAPSPVVPSTPATVAPKPSESWARRAARHQIERAESRLRQGDTSLALVEYNDAVRMDPSFGAAYLGLGAVRELIGDWREAERVYTIATRLFDSKAEALAKRAQVRRTLGRDEEAFRDLEAAVSETADRRWLRVLGDWYVERRAWPAALVTWRRYLAEAEREGGSDRSEASLRVRALSVLAAEADPVLSGRDHPSWVRRSLAQIAERSR